MICVCTVSYEFFLNDTSIAPLYVFLSGQSVNFQKSGIHFSSNVKPGKRAEISILCC